MDKEFQKLQEEVKEIVSDEPLLKAEYWCRPDGGRCKFVHMETSLTAERAAIAYAVANRMPDKSIVHVRAQGRFMIHYRNSGDVAVLQQMGANDEMLSTIKVVKS
jgi:hypothetical protein